ncbi:type II secretion system protein [bacterium CPR1]|nr:type II secretion system protein [bacterium CPR1]
MSRRAFTLVEVMISGGLLLTLIALSVQVFLPALGIWRRNQAKASVQQAALSAVYRIRHDLGQSAPQLVHAREGILILLSAGEPPSFDEHGQPLWSEWVGFWLDDRERLWRFTRSLAAPSAEQPTVVASNPPTPAELARGRILARGVKSFLPSPGPTGGVRYRLELQEGAFRYELLGGGNTAYGGQL